MRRILLLLLLNLAGTTMLFAQSSISGVVTENGEPMVGVNVLVKGSMTGAVTGLDGSYTLMANIGDVLIASFIGCEDQEIAVMSEGQTINFALKPSSVEIDAVVAIGYGYVKKSDLTGSVSSVNTDMLKQANVASVDQALQGLAAGVTVNANSGQPGATAEVRVRGIGTINNANPLYVVDGVMVSDISYLNPGDVESTEVLKDASATAIYGSRGANGVILITTKRGKSGEAIVNFNSSWSFQNAANKIELMGSEEFANTLISINATASEKAVYEALGFNDWLSTYRLGSSDYFPTNLDYSTIDTDWQDEIFKKNAFMQNYDLSVMGGTDKSNYAFSASYFDQEGTIMGSDFLRMTVRANTSFQVKKWLKIGENVTYVTSSSNTATVNAESPESSIISAAIAMAPWDPTHYPDGSVNSSGEDLSGQIAAASNFKNVINPFTMVEEYYPMSDNERLIGDIYLELTPAKGLTIRSDVSHDLNIYRYRLFKDSYDYSSADSNEDNYLSSSMSRSSTFMLENVVSYHTDINKKHSLSLMGGQTVEEYNYYSISGSGSTILNSTENNWYLNQTTDDQTYASDSADRTRRTSYFGRVNYSFNSRYLFTFNFRADGSSLFSEGNNWGYFPSAAFAWRLSDEEWMPKFENLGSVKVRAGWGQIGNDQVGSDSFTMTMFNEGPTFVDYVFGSTQALADGATVLTYVNDGGKWETTEQLDFGVDVSAFNNRISATLDLYQRDTKDMLLYTETPAHVGNYYAPLSNVGLVRNRGLEFTLGLQNNFGELNLAVNGNVSFIKNELIALNGGSAIYYDDGIRMINEGYALYTFYGYEYAGVYSSDEEATEHLPNSAATVSAGDAKFIDQNGDGKIDDSDKVDIGNPFPWLTYGLGINANYKNFDLQLFFQGVHGNEIYNALRTRTEGDGTASNLSTAMRDVWTEDNTTGTIPNPTGNSMNSAVSSRFVENGAYLRLKNLQLGYQVPSHIINKVGLSNLRCYVSATNLFTLTGYSGYDPEVSNGVDYGNYPQSRTFTFGINMSF
ncbi:MAG: TonB-dependent receptor [Rikenellaceae bacterium]